MCVKIIDITTPYCTILACVSIFYFVKHRGIRDQRSISNLIIITVIFVLAISVFNQSDNAIKSFSCDNKSFFPQGMEVQKLSNVYLFLQQIPCICNTWILVIVGQFIFQNVDNFFFNLYPKTQTDK